MVDNNASAGALFAHWLLHEKPLEEHDADMQVTAAQTRVLGEQLNHLIRNSHTFRRTLQQQITQACQQSGDMRNLGDEQAPYTIGVEHVAGDPRTPRLISVSLGDEFHLTLENRNGPIDHRLDEIVGQFHEAIQEVGEMIHEEVQDQEKGEDVDAFLASFAEPRNEDPLAPDTEGGHKPKPDNGPSL